MLPQNRAGEKLLRFSGGGAYNSGYEQADFSDFAFVFNDAGHPAARLRAGLSPVSGGSTP
jgi:hypothetical protein